MQLTQILRIRAGHLVRSVLKYLPSSHELARIYRTTNGVFAIGATDTMFMSRFRRGQAHGHDEIDQIKSLVAADSHVLVVGTHVGTLAVPISRWFRYITAIEANPTTFPLLQANVVLNERENIRLVKVAAGESDGAINFVLNKSNTGGSKREPKIKDIRYYFDHPETIEVAMKRLDDIVQDQVNAIIMDIEGSEYFALKGMPRILSEADILFIEFLPHHLRNVAGVDPDSWYLAIGQAFRYLYVPSTRKLVEGDEIVPLLRAMFVADESDYSIIFSKTPLAIH